MFNFNPFKKAETVEQDAPNADIQTSEEVLVESKPKTIEDVKNAKAELDELKTQRLEVLSNLRAQKDEIRAIGVAEFEDENRPVKRTETFNDLVSETEKELAEISQKIGDIRNEFDFTPTHVERLTERRDRVNDYIESIKQKMAPEYRAVEAKINGFFGTDSLERVYRHREPSDVAIFLESLSKEKVILPEVKNFLDKVQGLSVYDKGEEILTELKSFRTEILKAIDEKTFYKTPGEVNEAYYKIDRGIRLTDEITKILSDAENKYGDFKNQKGSF